MIVTVTLSQHGGDGGAGHATEMSPVIQSSRGLYSHEGTRSGHAG